MVGAITYVARRGMHRYPHLSGCSCATRWPSATASSPERLILGNGAAELLGAATRALIEPGQQLLTLWPAYPLYPLMARRAHGRAERIEGGVEALLEAAAGPARARDRLGQPERPDGRASRERRARAAARGSAADVAVLLDEALIEFSDAQEQELLLALLEQHPRLLVFRTFSKAWGLAGLRIGYAIGGPGSEELLAELDPDLGVSELSQAGALEALRSCSELIERRARCVEERPR